MTSDKPSLRPGEVYRALRGLAFLSLLFVLTVSLLLAVNWLQTRRAAPLDSPVLKELIAQAIEQSQDAARIEQIRALDTLARRAYFESASFARTGGWLLLGGGLLLLACLKCMNALRPRLPQPDAAGAVDCFAGRAARLGLTAGGLVLCGLAVALILRLPPQFPPAARDVAAGPGADQEASTPAAIPAPEAPVSEMTMATNWPSFRGGRRLGLAPHANPPTSWNGVTGQHIKWKVAVPRAGFSSPIVWEDRLFLTGGDADLREVYCFDTETGALRWQRAVQGIPGSPAEAPKVSEDTGYAAATMATDGRRVYAIFATGDLAAFTLDGEPVWARNLGAPKNPYGYASSPVVADGRLFIQYDQSDRGQLLALDPATGKTLWEQARKVHPSWASPAVVGHGTNTLVALMAAPSLFAYRASDGQPVWQHDGLGGEPAPSPAAGAGLVIFGTQYAKLVALHQETGAVAWETDEAEIPDVSSPVANERLLFLATGVGVLSCLDLATGKERWKKEYDDGFYASPILAGDRLYTIDRTGLGRVIKAAEAFELIAESPLGEPCVCTPAPVGSRLYVRGMKHLYAIEEAPAP